MVLVKTDPLTKFEHIRCGMGLSILNNPIRKRTLVLAKLMEGLFVLILIKGFLPLACLISHGLHALECAHSIISHMKAIKHDLVMDFSYPLISRATKKSI